MKPENLNQIVRTTVSGHMDAVRIGIAALFVIGVMLMTMTIMPDTPNGVLLVVAAMIGGYMALNIGANDVANNVGPAVGAKAITIFWAIVIAGIFEASGAIIAGGDVVGTVKNGIIDPELIGDSNEFIWLMMGALLAASIWLNLATYLGAPVSTTHSIVGGVLGAGVAAGGLGVADWGTLSQIVASWVISPMFGGVIAAFSLYLIKRTITYRKDKLTAAERWVPIYIAFMGWAFSTYLIMKGLKKIIKVDFLMAALIGLLIAGAVYLVTKNYISKRCKELDNDKSGVGSLFTIPLIFSAALLSFAHGANDVANAVGPLAAINDAVSTAAIHGEAHIPLWVLLIGAVGIALGLALYGPKLIKVVGSEITELDQMRAFCVALAAAVTVIIASQLGLPVSSTHVAVGAVFGVGFLREAIKANYQSIIEDIRSHHTENDHTEEDLEQFFTDFEDADFKHKDQMIKTLKKNSMASDLKKGERKKLKKKHKQQLVRRSALYKIVVAWVITVPASAFMAALFYFTIRGMLL